MKFASKTEVVLDIECYRDYFLVALKGVESKREATFEFYKNHPLDKLGLLKALRRYRIITFNGINYDIPIMALSLREGVTNQELKDASDDIILRNLKPWDLEKIYTIPKLNFLDHIDLIEVAPGQAGLKLYSGRLHSKRMQDLPIDPSDFIVPQHREIMVKYCVNDLDNTIDLYRELAPQIELRTRMSEEYGIDLRSKSDAQIAEAVIKSAIERSKGSKVYKPDFVSNFSFNYEAPPYIKFKTEKMQNLLASILATRFRLSQSGNVELPYSLADAQIRIGNGIYRLGIGGLHSSEKSVSYRSNGQYQLVDVDVDSFYPRIILNLGLYPEHLGKVFLEVYETIVNRRLAAKKSGDKVTDAALKITINGSFGKFGSKYSTLSSPKLLIQTTLTGQLALLMLIERFEDSGLQVVSANTDGIVVYAYRPKLKALDLIVKNWEIQTNFTMSRAEYSALYSRDVNNYIAIKPDGKTKLKGVFGEMTLAKNPSTNICVDAVVNLVTKQIPLADTIEWNTDIRKFLSVRQVKGGGKWVKGETADAKLAQKWKKQRIIDLGWKEVSKNNWHYKGDSFNEVGLNTAYELSFGDVPEEYLGKAVRWYYGEGARGHIAYQTNGNKVAKTDGAIPIMELPKIFPLDLDHAWYIREAESMLQDVGYGFD